MKQSLNIRATQRVGLSPEQRQWFEFLQLSTLDLSHRVNRLLETNPLLGLTDDVLIEAMTSDDDVEGNPEDTREDVEDNYGERIEDRASEEEKEFLEVSGDYDADYEFDDQLFQADIGAQKPDWIEETIEATSDLREFLVKQIAFLQLNEHDRTIALAIIYSIDDDGRLSDPLEEILQGLQDSENSATLTELEVTLRLVQGLDPPGIGARDFAECWLLQLHGLSNESSIAGKAMTVITEHLTLFTNKQDDKLKKSAGLSDSEMLDIRRLIKNLDTKPGRQISSDQLHYQEPDEIVVRSEENWGVVLNPNVEHRLSINGYYLKYLGDSQEPEVKKYVEANLKEAKWFIRSLAQRSETILRVAKAIIGRQKGFLEHGSYALRPLMMTEIAELLDVSDSTISRAVNNKYIQTPHGLFELRSLFPSQLETKSGEGTSSDAVQALIKIMIDKEARDKPLSDQKIANSLEGQGINIARRTVAKYREQMGIGSTSDRRDRV